MKTEIFSTAKFVGRFIRKAFLTSALLVAFMASPVAQTGVAPRITFLETDQTLPAGLWRISLNGDVMTIDRNTAAGNNFSTQTTAISISSTPVITFGGDITGTATEPFIIKNVTSTATVPVFITTNDDLTAGIGGESGNIGIITNNVNRVNIASGNATNAIVTFNTTNVFNNASGTPRDTLTFDGTDLVGAGQQDSDSLIITGLSYDASAHDSDWKIFVDVTSNAGLSALSIRERVDASAFVEYMRLDQTGNILFTGWTHTFGETALQTDFRTHFGGNFGNTTGSTGGLFRIVDTYTSSVSTTQMYGGQIIPIMSTSAGTTSVVNAATFAIDDPLLTDNLTGGAVIVNASALHIMEAPTEGDDINAALIIGGAAQTGTYDAIVVDQADRTTNGFDDSGKIQLTGVSYDGSAHDSDWLIFNEMTANAGTGSVLNFQHRIDAAAFGTLLSIADDGSVTISDTSAAVFTLDAPTGTLNLVHNATNQMFFDFSGSVVGDTGAGIWINQTSPTDANYAIRMTGGSQLRVNAVTSVLFAIGGSEMGRYDGTNFTWKRPMLVDGVGDSIQFTVQANATQNADLVVFEQSTGVNVFSMNNVGKTLLGIIGSDGNDETPPELFTVIGGSTEVYDDATLGAETITDGAFPNSTNWAGAGEWSDTIAGATTYTFSATGNGTLTQTAAQRVTNNEGSNARWYKITYTLSSVTQGGNMVLSITNAFAASSVPLPATGNATFSVIFQSHATTADTADFVLDVTGAEASDTFTMDDLIVKEIIGGNIIFAGVLSGGGSNGIRVSGGGTVSTFETALGTVGATQTVDWRDGNHQAATLDENLTFTFIDPDGPGGFTMKLTQDGAGTNTVAWPGTVFWEAGSAPTITAAAAAVDLVSFYFDGTNYFGSVLQDMR